MKEKVMRGKAYAGNPYVRFDEGACSALPCRAEKKRVISLLALAVMCTCAQANTANICILGGTREFREFLQIAAGPDQTVASFDDMASLPFMTASNTLFVVVPEAGRNGLARPFDARQIAAMKTAAERGNRFYFENIQSEDADAWKFLGMRTFGASGVPIGQKIVESDVGLLQYRGRSYVPAFRCKLGEIRSRPKTVASISDAIGVNAVFLPAQERSAAVTVSSDGRRVFSLLRLSKFSPLEMRPHARWRAFYARLFADALARDENSIASAFDKVWPDVLADAGKRSSDDVVKKALDWHEKSGVLFSPDGAQGMREAVTSAGGWRDALRVDVNLMTGALFAWVGKVYGRADWIALGRNLADNILSRDNQTEDGFFRWFDRKHDAGRYVYATDHGRSFLAMENLYLATKDPRYLAIARKAADAFLSWQADDGLVTVCFDLNKGGRPPKGHSYNPVCYYENVPALFKMTDITGDRKYADAALKCVTTLAKTFPDFNFGRDVFYSINSVYGRFLLAAASAQRATDVDFSTAINGVLDFYERNQHSRGGISEIKIRLVANEEGGVGIGDGSDHIADLLYCNNFSFAALSLLMKLPSDKVKGIDIAKARSIYVKLRDFLSEAQIASPVARFDGAWMRAYDMDLGECHGLDRDTGWGPYCIETGWTMGTIPLVFLFEERDGSYF